MGPVIGGRVLENDGKGVSGGVMGTGVARGGTGTFTDVAGRRSLLASGVVEQLGPILLAWAGVSRRWGRDPWFAPS